LDICEQNVEEHQSTLPLLNILYKKSPSIEGDERPQTPQRKRINPIPSGCVQSPVYRRTKGLEPRGEAEEEEEEERSNEEERVITEESSTGEKKTTGPMSSIETPEPEEELRATKIPKPPTLSEDSNNRKESRVDNWIKKVKDNLRLAKIPTINQPSVIA